MEGVGLVHLPTMRARAGECVGFSTAPQYSPDDANSPKVDLFVVSTAAPLQNFGCKIVGRAAHSGTSGTDIVLGDKQRSKAEIADLDVHVSVEEQVAGFEISVDNLAGVKVLDSAAGLDQIPTDFRHGNEATLLDHIGERSIIADF